MTYDEIITVAAMPAMVKDRASLKSVSFEEIANVSNTTTGFPVVEGDTFTFLNEEVPRMVKYDTGKKNSKGDPIIVYFLPVLRNNVKYGIKDLAVLMPTGFLVQADASVTGIDDFRKEMRALGTMPIRWSRLKGKTLAYSGTTTVKVTSFKDGVILRDEKGELILKDKTFATVKLL